MIELDTIELSNFMSYGDYRTEIKLADMGQCLITGEVEQDTPPGFRLQPEDPGWRSNGSGKSSAVNALLWGLFNRTMHSANPGDRVINFHTGKPCTVTLRFKNGDRIDRIRHQGRTELLYVRAGNEQRLTADTLSTTRAMQTELTREFQLDWDIFCGSVFFSQYGRPWMEMPDAGRKQAVERMLHVDRFTLYGDVAKEKCTQLDQQRQQLRAKLELVQQQLREQQQNQSEYTQQQQGFEAGRQQRQQQAQLQADQAAQEMRQLEPLPELEQLRGKWEIVAQIRQKIDGMRQQATALGEQRAPLQRRYDDHRRGAEEQQRRIQQWQQRAGKLCLECEQGIPHAHTDSKVELIQQQLQQHQDQMGQLQQQLLQLQQQRQQLTADASRIEQQLQSREPALTVAAAQLLHREWKGHQRQQLQAQQRVQELAVEQDPYGQLLERCQAKQQQLQQQLERLQAQASDCDGLWQHYWYIHKSYSDRRRIKSYVFAEHIPYVNERLAHYLDIFGLDLRLEFTDTLGIKSDQWGYDFYCGGERKRTDVALMLAMFDLHEQIYGRQCNVMVLDEVDGRMDSAGIDALIQIIKNDLSTRVESVFIISHRGMMADTFPRQLHVRRSNRFSVLETIR